jgi:hypothetical protein
MRLKTIQIQIKSAFLAKVRRQKSTPVFTGGLEASWQPTLAASKRSEGGQGGAD